MNRGTRALTATISVRIDNDQGSNDVALGSIELASGESRELQFDVTLEHVAGTVVAVSAGDRQLVRVREVSSQRPCIQLEHPPPC